MIAPETPPDAAPMITASAVAMNSALPRPQPARNPTISPIDPDAPASALKAITRARPTSSVLRGPMRLETKPVTSIERPVMAK